jgi:alpha-amylase/alpha-mannosidase (GH57 family)
MKSKLFLCLNLLLVFTILLAACGKTGETPSPIPTATMADQPTPIPSATAGEQPTPIPSVTAGEQPIYLAIIWHQHQPVYFKDPDTGIYAKPWVRVHATKDYVDMAAMLQEYPDIHVTFNLTPSLIRQLDDFQAGAKDLYWVTAEVPADQLTAEQQQFILERFFDTNREIIARFPRYQELLTMRDGGSEYTTQDYLDLQILFNLAWVDPDWLAEEPLSNLVEKGENFSEADKAVLFAEHARLISEVIPVHRQLQEAGQIEVTMTPFAHPILPLLISTDLALEALPNLDLPGVEFSYSQDAVAQIELGIELYEQHFGLAPRGMWPAEGSVAQEIVSMVSEAGIQWMASDEGVLASSLGMESFTRNASEVVTEPDTLYRPYYVQGTEGEPVAMVFRDVVISDKVGFTYSGVSGEAAAQDFLNRIHAIRDELIAQGEQGPNLVSVILDGENAWEYYENDGKEFLNSLYSMLSEDELIKTVTPSEFLEMAPEQPVIDDLWAGSWIGHDFSTWIGEDEENRAWEYLAEVRAMLAEYEQGSRITTPEILEQAQIAMYIAEGSDWFWWYGSDQNSGNDEAFDQQFRDTLRQVYIILGEEPPAFLDVPIIPQAPVAADLASTGLLTPTIDGQVDSGEWDAAGSYLASGGAMAAAQPFFTELAYGFDTSNLYIKVGYTPGYSFPAGNSILELYMTAPGRGDVNNLSRSGNLLGFPANRLVEVIFTEGVLATANLYSATGDNLWGEVTGLEQAAQGENLVELGVPLDLLGDATTGDEISLRAIFSKPLEAGGTTIVDVDQLPAGGPALLTVPDISDMTVILDITDPADDDHGPGTYTYAQDAVFTEGSFDILNFKVGVDAENVIFKFTMAGPVENPWRSSNGLSIQTFDIYIDTDGDGEGGVALLPGRNLALQEGDAWDYAITIEGWLSGVYIPGDEGPEQIATGSEMVIAVDPGQQSVIVRVPMIILGSDPESWRYAAMVMSQEGYPTGGVMRVRDVNVLAEQWRLGGAPSGSMNHTRVIDLVWAEPGQQETWLSTYTPRIAPQTQLVEADFARIGMFAVGE